MYYARDVFEDVIGHVIVFIHFSKTAAQSGGM